MSGSHETGAALAEAWPATSGGNAAHDMGGQNRQTRGDIKDHRRLEIHKDTNYDRQSKIECVHSECFGHRMADTKEVVGIFQ